MAAFRRDCRVQRGCATTRAGVTAAGLAGGLLMRTVMAVVWTNRRQSCAITPTFAVEGATGRRSADTASADMPPLPSPGVDQLCDEYLRLEAFYAAHGDRPATVRVLEWELECPTPASALAFLDYIACRRMNDFKTSEAVPVILDCGANIGYTALWYKRLYPAAQVVAFEPDPVFAPMLRRNLARNGAGDVTVVAAAAWTADGDAAWLTQDVDGSRLADAGATGATTVATVDLARILRDFARIDLLKIDIEGAEYALLPHLAEALAYRGETMRQKEAA